jgi:hypothetical protein
MTVTSIGPVHKDLGNGHFMVTSLDFDDVANKLHVHSDLTTTNKVSGFHGQVRPIFFGDQGQNLGSVGNDLECDQAPLFGAAHKSYDYDIDTPPGTQGIAVAQFWHPHWPLGQIGDALGTAFTDIGGFVQGLGQWIDQNGGTLLEIGFVLLVIAGTALCISGALATAGISCAVLLVVAA